MRQALSPSTGRRDGLARVCRVWGMARSTVDWPRHEARGRGRRPGPLGPCTDEAWVGQTRTVWQASPFHGEGYRQVWARWRDAGIRPAPRRVLRLMRTDGLLAPPRPHAPHGPKAHDETVTTAGIGTMGGTDMTTTVTQDDGPVAMVIAVEHGSAACVGRHAATHGTRFEALEPIRQGVRTPVGDFGKDVAHGLSLRHDHGSQ
jgi:putative transposase